MKIAIAGGTGTVGRHVVDAARKRGHDVAVLTRSAGVDLLTGAGLRDALNGTDVVIDVASVLTQSEKESKAFFSTAISNLLAAEEAVGVPHHVALSIVGSDKAPYGYYAGKQVQEKAVTASRIPWTLMRATQFHEFAQQLYGQIKLGPINVVPTMVSQPVAARDVGERLVALAEGRPAGRTADFAGPEVLRMADMVRAYAAAVDGKGPIWEIPIPGAFGKAMRDGTLVAGPTADRGTLTFDAWVADVARDTDRV